ncbi:MAG: hypothetical protein WC462_04625 [archaeon]
MDKKIVLVSTVALVVLALMATIVIAADPAPVQNSISYYLRLMNANIVSGANESSTTLDISKGSVQRVNPSSPILSVSCSIGGVCASDNISVIEENGQKYFRAVFNYNEKKDLIGQNFVIDLSKYPIDYSKGSLVRGDFYHSKYTFSIDALFDSAVSKVFSSSSGERFLAFSVKKSDSVPLDCLKLVSFTSLKSKLASSWESIVSGDISQLVGGDPYAVTPSVGVPVPVVSPSGYTTVFTNLLILDVQNPVKQDCYDEQKPQDVDLISPPELKFDLVKTKIESNKITIDFRLDILKKAESKTYIENMPQNMS